MEECPRLIDFGAIGQSGIGYISVAESTNLPFQVQRVFWTYYTPQEVIRGRHAHYRLRQILIALSGTIEVETESRAGERMKFLLNDPKVGLYLPPAFWHTMKYSHTAVQLTLASTQYDEADYIREYALFKSGLTPGRPA